MRGLSLIGLPMVGKSVIAKQISKNLGMELLDVDDWVTGRLGMQIPEAASIYGDGFILEKEQECIEHCRLENKIIATPGSIIYTGTKNKLKQETLVLYLEDNTETIIKRLQSDNSKHRKILGTGSLEEILSGRLPLYQEWSARKIACQQKSIKDIAGEAAEIYIKGKIF